jgi:hypothetical protein
MTEQSKMKQEAGPGSSQYQSGGNMNIHNYPALPEKSYKQYLKLVEEFQLELKNGDGDIQGFIDKISHYVSIVDTNYIGLEKKLSDGNFPEDYGFAKRAKDYYAKKLTENNLSRASQKIHAFLLAKVCVVFNLQIRTAIAEGKSKSEIKAMLVSNIVEPIEEMLGENNVLELYSDDITAMIYFLTGNCHITWKKDADLPSSV